MIVKKHFSQEGRIILAVVDSDLIGKKLIEGNTVLDLSSDFYKGEETTPEETKEIMQTCHVFNLVGKESVELGKELGLVEEVKEICSVKYAMSVIP
jgi:uncharacterized protein